MRAFASGIVVTKFTAVMLGTINLRYVMSSKITIFRPGDCAAHAFRPLRVGLTSGSSGFRIKGAGTGTRRNQGNGQ